MSLDPRLARAQARARGPLALVLALALALGLSACAQGGEPGDAPPEELPRVAFTNLSDGDEVSSPLNVCMEAFNLEIEPSGEVREGSGHFHVLYDLTEEERASYTSGGVAIPKDVDPRLVHLGDGSGCTEIDLPAGEHTLLAVVADGGHVTMDPPVTEDVTITVE